MFGLHGLTSSYLAEVGFQFGTPHTTQAMADGVQKEVLVMRLYKNMSFNEISENTGVTINTALGRMRYALINMRKLIEKHKIILVN